MSKATRNLLGLILAGLGVLAICLLVSVAWAGNSGNDGVDWQVLSGGGAPSESGSGRVALNGTLGQTAIGPSGASHDSLSAGFWYGLGQGVYRTYLPLVVRGY